MTIWLGIQEKKKKTSCEKSLGKGDQGAENPELRGFKE